MLGIGSRPSAQYVSSFYSGVSRLGTTIPLLSLTQGHLRRCPRASAYLWAAETSPLSQVSVSHFGIIRETNQRTKKLPPLGGRRKSRPTQKWTHKKKKCPSSGSSMAESCSAQDSVMDYVVSTAPQCGCWISLKTGTGL
jgi:hypothetical protein